MSYTMHPVNASIVERAISRYLIRLLLEAGYMVSVYDGEVTTVRHARDSHTILAAMASTSEDLIRFRNEDGSEKGSFLLIWGNGTDLISDSSVNAATDRIQADMDDIIQAIED